MKKTAQTRATSTIQSERRVHDDVSSGRFERLASNTADSHIRARQSTPVGRPSDPSLAGYTPLVASDSGTYRTSRQYTSAGRSFPKPIKELQNHSNDVPTSTHSGPHNDERQVCYAMQQARRAVKEIYRYDRLLLRLCNGVFDALSLPDKLRFQQSNKALRQNHQDSAGRQEGLVEILLGLLSNTFKCSQSGHMAFESEPRDAAVRKIRQQAAKLTKLNARVGAQRAALTERNEKVGGLESRLREHYEHILHLKDSIFEQARCISQRDETIASLRAQLIAAHKQHIRAMADMREAHERTLLKSNEIRKAEISCIQEGRFLQRRVAYLSTRPGQSIPAIAYNDESCGSAVSVSRGSTSSDESFVHRLSDFDSSDSSEESDVSDG
ncbi:hypothetical protein Slin15195_G068110 [Septoria linicola]|uniref:Uncharacterized protein n=1 Tax=Septoria linicola TaxID=215465 RepID=A0A9Q9EKN9_9PEZI|nr:hypothetical protein Slin15195_G068110 [Septoria linicola]